MTAFSFSRTTHHYKIVGALARIKRRTSPEPNQMQMRKTLCSSSLSFVSIRFSSCEVRRLTLPLHSNAFPEIPGAMQCNAMQQM